VSLEEYHQKRRFDSTPEPRGASSKGGLADGSRTYIVQKHMATNLHYDFRLAWKGVLLSWAIPKGPSVDPATKRLAMQTEDHPLEYAAFEGVIPAGEYGGGTVLLWDRGTWEPEVADVDEALRGGDLKFSLNGEKLHGSWVLVRTRGFGSKSATSWLLIKHRDRFAGGSEPTEAKPRSVATDRLLVDIARDDGGDVEHAAKGDPGAPKPARRKGMARPARPKGPKAPA
jgi:bifunctional non-homologous end joining protein LigD